MATPTSAAPAATSSFADPSPSSAPSGGGPQNSPLLFFVALGFGVVFTNLWIIVGVKYCFRYNARNRARQQGEDGEPIDLTAMPHRRRRREKKLMTMDEVNERFPITKYKTWVSTRAAQGLSTEGGVSQSRAASIKEAEGVIAPIETTETEAPKKSIDLVTTETREIPAAEASTPAATTNLAEPSTFSTATAGMPEVKQVASHTESADEDEEEAIPPAVPGASEMLAAPGDSCAICIDTLEDNDDVRGLSCGHAFHASCLDPWLTSRRACCPLCKADYYVPKPRPENADAAGTLAADGTTNPFDAVAGEIRRPSLAASTPAGGISRYIPRLTGRMESLPEERRPRPRPGVNAAAQDREILSFFRRAERDQPSAPAAPAPTPEVEATHSSEGRTEGRRWMPSMPNWRRRGEQSAATPSQLEAGNTSST